MDAVSVVLQALLQCEPSVSTSHLLGHEAEAAQVCPQALHSLTIPQTNIFRKRWSKSELQIKYHRLYVKCMYHASISVTYISNFNVFIIVTQLLVKIAISPFVR